MPKESFGRAVVYWRNQSLRYNLVGVKGEHGGKVLLSKVRPPKPNYGSKIDMLQKEGPVEGIGPG